MRNYKLKQMIKNNDLNRLIDYIDDSKNASAEERVTIFLNTRVTTGNDNKQDIFKTNQPSVLAYAISHHADKIVNFILDNTDAKSVKIHTAFAPHYPDHNLMSLALYYVGKAPIGAVIDMEIITKMLNSTVVQAVQMQRNYEAARYDKQYFNACLEGLRAYQQYKRDEIYDSYEL